MQTIATTSSKRNLYHPKRAEQKYTRSQTGGINCPNLPEQTSTGTAFSRAARRLRVAQNSRRIFPVLVPRQPLPGDETPRKRIQPPPSPGIQRRRARPPRGSPFNEALTRDSSMGVLGIQITAHRYNGGCSRQNQSDLNTESL